ncbi:E3 SUMO-protein ligase ZBED1-like, partial [Rhopalosiphum padi]|uniref:E3 SUMO-protein ligase ZBED1-like n=1 Tax=Rhopalosiphum padi TaxID=40932 RepID=UPI00298DBA1A
MDPINDPVVILLETPFRRWNIIHKNDFVRKSLDKKGGKINYISLTTDGWTSTAIDSYLTFTAHYFDDNWKLCSVTLSIEEIQESHTAENLKDSIINVIESWNLNSKITGISHDNAANISNAVKLFYDQDIYSNRCAAHTLQLAVNKYLDLRTYRPLLKTASKIVASFRQSSKRTYALENYLVEKECKKLNLKQSCPTRWNSTLDMLERSLELLSAVVVIMSDRTLFNSKIAKDQELLEEDWEKIEILVTLLKPLKTATTVLCADQNVTISIVLPIVKSLIVKHYKPNDLDDCRFSTLFKESIIHELSTRFSVQIDVNNDCEREISITQIASILDPRYKNMSFESSENIKNRIKQIKNAQHSMNYLKKTQIMIPSFQASSASSERVFSVAGNILSPKRNRITPCHLSALVFLKQ